MEGLAFYFIHVQELKCLGIIQFDKVRNEDIGA